MTVLFKRWNTAPTVCVVDGWRAGVLRDRYGTPQPVGLRYGIPTQAGLQVLIGA